MSEQSPKLHIYRVDNSKNEFALYAAHSEDEAFELASKDRWVRKPKGYRYYKLGGGHWLYGQSSTYVGSAGVEEVDPNRTNFGGDLAAALEAARARPRNHLGRYSAIGDVSLHHSVVNGKGDHIYVFGRTAIWETHREYRRLCEMEMDYTRLKQMEEHLQALQSLLQRPAKTQAA